MTATLDVQRLRSAWSEARRLLQAERVPGGWWEGELSSSALSTATAVSALSVVSRERFRTLIEEGMAWLVRCQNRDGGWGDTSRSPSNLATSLLVRSAIELSRIPADESVGRVETYIEAWSGPTWTQRAEALRAFYGGDRTFSVPILTNAALAGFVEWNDIPRLPFEMARFPRSWLRALRLHVVSYALPALIAIGQLLHARHPTRNPLKRLLRSRSVKPTMRLLEQIQPSSGGFLEATPLTSFVLMSLAANGRAEHPVARRCLAFLQKSRRRDGSWPIDTNLSTWVTTQAIEALTSDGSHLKLPPVREWLLRQQHVIKHPYTDSPPGGWAWTDLSGGVPDADDTSGALIALHRLGGEMPRQAVTSGLEWLLGLQNRDGGWPTFCPGWGRLPFDRSAPDLTAHVLRAIKTYEGTLSEPHARQAVRRGFDFLKTSQTAAGAWNPLWFGNQFVPDGKNPVYGTARVLLAYAECDALDAPEVRRAVRFLREAQLPMGAWSGAPDAPPTIEETALAVRGLAAVVPSPHTDETVVRGLGFLFDRLREGTLAETAPIGLYFASLWYSEKLYPLIWTVGALGSVLAAVSSGTRSA